MSVFSHNKYNPVIIMIPIYFTFLLFLSCETEVDSYVYGDERAVVYSLINPDDSIHYVKLNKTWQASHDARISAKITDSLYFTNPEIKLEVRSGEGWMIYENQFQQVLDIPKKPGFFGTAINKIYQLNGKLSEYINEGYNLFLIIDIPGRATVTSASSTIYQKPKIKQPINDPRTIINITEEEYLPIAWYDYFDHEYYEFILRINFTENKAGTDTESYVYVIRKRHSLNNPDNEYHRLFEVKLTLNNFLRTIALSLKDDPEVNYRKISNMDIILKATGQDFYSYMTSGTTTADINGKPYSNVVNGMGVFACVMEDRINNLRIGVATLNSISNSEHTKHLKFTY